MYLSLTIVFGTLSAILTILLITVIMSTVNRTQQPVVMSTVAREADTQGQEEGETGDGNLDSVIYQNTPLEESSGGIRREEGDIVEIDNHN